MEQLRVLAAGQWEPEEPEPCIPSPPEPPQPQPGESHQSYAQRYLQWATQTHTNPEWLKWRARKAWKGQTLDELRDLIESDASVPNRCLLINPQQK